MLFITYEDIELIYGTVDNFIDWLVNCSQGCSYLIDDKGIWYYYDHDTCKGRNNEGYIDFRL